MEELVDPLRGVDADGLGVEADGLGVDAEGLGVGEAVVVGACGVLVVGVDVGLGAGVATGLAFGWVPGVVVVLWVWLEVELVPFFDVVRVVVVRVVVVAPLLDRVLVTLVTVCELGW